LALALGCGRRASGRREESDSWLSYALFFEPYEIGLIPISIASTASNELIGSLERSCSCLRVCSTICSGTVCARSERPAYSFAALGFGCRGSFERSSAPLTIAMVEVGRKSMGSSRLRESVATMKSSCRMSIREHACIRLA